METAGQKFLNTVRTIPESTPKEERIKIFFKAQKDFDSEVEAFRTSERKRLKELMELL